MLGAILGPIIEVVTSPIKSDKIDVRRSGDKVVKTYVYRRLKIPFTVDRIMMKLGEGIVPPLRNPLKIEVSEPSKLEEGLITEDVKVDVTLPAIGLISAEKIKRKIRGTRRRYIPVR
ncbi:hypothetical protein DRP04_00755 [Archaeoglobales archaeon]|nr:MAG: hypothetical protein DRP04_00755 [Archaeoglobales archaeon]